MSTMVKVINELRNRSQFMRGKDAAHYVKVGRAAWIGSGQIRLIASHPDNIVAAQRARSWKASYQPSPDDLDPVTQALRLFGTNPRTGNKWMKGSGRGGGLAAVDRAATRFQGPRPRVDHLLTNQMPAGQQNMPAGLARQETQLQVLRERSKKADFTGNASLAESLRREVGAIQRALTEEGKGGTRTDHVALDRYRRAKDKPNDALFPGWGEGEKGTCVVPMEALIAGSSPIVVTSRRATVSNDVASPKFIDPSVNSTTLQSK